MCVRKGDPIKTFKPKGTQSLPAKKREMIEPEQQETKMLGRAD